MTTHYLSPRTNEYMPQIKLQPKYLSLLHQRTLTTRWKLLYLLVEPYAANVSAAMRTPSLYLMPSTVDRECGGVEVSKDA